MLSNYGAGEDSRESLDCKEIKPVNPKRNQSWIFIGRTDAEAKALIFGHLIQRTDSMEKTLKLGKIELKAGGEVGDKGWDGFDVSIDMSLSKLEIVKDKEAWHAAVHGAAKSGHEQQQQQQQQLTHGLCPLQGQVLSKKPFPFNIRSVFLAKF